MKIKDVKHKLIFFIVLSSLQSLNQKGEKQRANYWIARMTIAANEEAVQFTAPW